MRTAVDSNILSAIWSREPRAAEIAAELGRLQEHGAVVLSPVAFAELMAYPHATPKAVQGLLTDSRVQIEFALSEATWTEAGVRFAAYAERRRKSTGTMPRQMLADFVVGAHALHCADRLFTLDERRYRKDFPELALLTLH